MAKRIEYKKGQPVGDYGISYLEERPKKKGCRPYRRALFRCHCGSEFEAIINGVSSGSRISCGCLSKAHLANMSISNTKHGLSRHPIYSVWNDMINRCYRKENQNYHNYGGKGVDVCEKWRNSCKEFIEWAENNGYKKGLQIDRIDNNKGYHPENCRFVTALENARNKSAPRNSRFGIAGVTLEGGRYRAVITAERKKINLGTFDDFFEACCARKSAEVRHWRQ